MPTFEITSPDGKSYEVTAPEGATQAEAFQMLQSQIAGPSEAMRKAVAMAGADPAPPVPPPSVLVGMGHGATNIIDGLKQWLMAIQGDDAGVAELHKERGTNEQIYQQGRRNAMPIEQIPGYATYENESQLAGAHRAGMTQRADPGFDVPSAAGEAAALAPVGLVGKGASMLGTAAKLAAAGGVAGAVPYTEAGPLSPQKALQVGLGATAGAASPFLMKGISKMAGAAWDKAADVAGSVRAQLSGATTQKAIEAALNSRGSSLHGLAPGIKKAILSEARSQMRTSGRVNNEALSRRAFLASAGFVDDAAPTRAQLLHDGPEWGFERNMATQAEGADLAQRFSAQQRRFAEMGDDVTNALGGRESTPYRIGESIRGAVRSKSREMQEEVSALYTKAREEFGDKFVVAPRRLMSVMDDVSDNAEADAISDSIRRRLSKLGMLDDSGAIKESANSVRAMSLDQAEELRKFIGGLGNQSPNHSRVRKMLIDAIDDDALGGVDSAGNTVGGAQGRGGYIEARAAARERFAEFEPLERLIDDGLSNEDIAKRFIEGGSVDQIQALRSSLVSGTPEQIARGEAAWNNVRRHLWEKVMDKSRDQKGDMTAGRLNKALGRFEPEELDLLFGDNRQAIQTIKDAADILVDEPRFSPVSRSHTPNAQLQMMTRLIPNVKEALEAGRASAAESRLVDALAGKMTQPRIPAAAAINAQEPILRPALVGALLNANSQLLQTKQE